MVDKILSTTGLKSSLKGMLPEPPWQTDKFPISKEVARFASELLQSTGHVPVWESLQMALIFMLKKSVVKSQTPNPSPAWSFLSAAPPPSRNRPPGILQEYQVWTSTVLHSVFLINDRTVHKRSSSCSWRATLEGWQSRAQIFLAFESTWTAEWDL